jgi:signal transduction histidine kinase
MIGTNWDITAEKEAIAQIAAREAAEKANRAKSEFLANMSHEIRTPLNSVIGFTDLLEKTQLSIIQRQYAHSANVSGHALLGLINDILDFSKIEAGMLDLDIIKSDMVQLFEDSIDIVKFASAEKDIELLLDIDPNIPRFGHVDAIRMKQILANLLGNAVKFTLKGEVELKIGYQALDGDNGKLSLSVRDTGIGINKKHKGLI